MLKHNAPLALQQGTPAIGRFFPKACSQQTLQNGDLYVQFSGVGYAWTSLSQRIGFTMGGTVTYEPDFRMDGCTAYAYFPTRQIEGSDFQIRMIEQPVANIINQLTPVGAQFGRELVNAQLAQGFTVIKEGNGNADFGLGMIETGKRPTHPFDVHGSSRITYENARVEVHQNQRDFIGPIVIEENNRGIFVQATLDGAPAIDVIYMRAQEAEPWLEQYMTNGVAGPPPGMPLGGDVLQMGPQPYQRMIPAPPGTYYVVLDNTTTAGQANPAAALLGAPPAAVSYVVEIGDR